MKKWVLSCLAVGISLLLSARPSEPFRFALVTDIHVSNPENNEDLRRTVRDINSLTEYHFRDCIGRCDRIRFI